MTPAVKGLVKSARAAMNEFTLLEARIDEARDGGLKAAVEAVEAEERTTTIEAFKAKYPIALGERFSRLHLYVQDVLLAPGAPDLVFSKRMRLLYAIVGTIDEFVADCESAYGEEVKARDR